MDQNIFTLERGPSPGIQPSYRYAGLCVAALVLLLLWQFSRLLIASLRDPLRDIPGPWLARWTRLWYQRQMRTKQLEKINLELHRKLGPIVRLAPDIYSIDDPDAARLIYGIGNMTFEKSPWYATQTAPGLTTLFTDQNSASHARTKRKLGSTYSASSVVQYEPFVDHCIEILLLRLGELGAAGSVFDLGMWFQYFAFDVIGEITFSHRFGFLDHGEDPTGLIKAQRSSSAYTARIGLWSWIHPYAWWFQSFCQSNGEKLMTDFVDRNIMEHKASVEAKRDGPPDFVRRWLGVQETSPEKMSIREIRIGAGQNVGAGSHTISSVLSSIIYNLCKHYNVAIKLKSELDEATRNGELSSLARYQEAIKLPYLQAVIKESLRLFSVAASPLPRVVPAGGATLAGRHFSKDTWVGVNPHVAHRNKAVFGLDADLFHPERWLGEKEKVRQMDHYFLAWSMGSQACIGKHIANLEISKLIVDLVQRYDIELEHPEDDLKNVNDVLLNRVAELRCRITERKKC